MCCVGKEKCKLYMFYLPLKQSLLFVSCHGLPTDYLCLEIVLNYIFCSLHPPLCLSQIPLFLHIIFSSRFITFFTETDLWCLIHLVQLIIFIYLCVCLSQDTVKDTNNVRLKAKQVNKIASDNPFKYMNRFLFCILFN